MKHKWGPAFAQQLTLVRFGKASLLNHRATQLVLNALRVIILRGSMREPMYGCTRTSVQQSRRVRYILNSLTPCSKTSKACLIPVRDLKRTIAPTRTWTSERRPLPPKFNVVSRRWVLGGAKKRTISVNTRCKCFATQH